MASADVAIASRREGAWESVGLRRLTLLSIYWVAIGWLWNALGAQVLPPVITRMVGQAHQGTALSALEGFGTLVAVVWQPVVGALSDRTRLRWGRRRPYIAGGALGSSLFLVIMAFVGVYFWLLIAYFLLQVASNTAQAPYQGLGPNAVPEKDFGKFGAFYGMGNLVGTLIGFLVTGIFTASGHYGAALFAMAAMLVVSMVLTVTLVPDRGRPDGSLGMSVGEITFGTFQISPRRHGDFLRLMGSRLLILMGVVGLETYAQFFFKDVFYPHSTNHANAATTYLLAIIVVLADRRLLSGGAPLRPLGPQADGDRLRHPRRARRAGPRLLPLHAAARRDDGAGRLPPGFPGAGPGASGSGSRSGSGSAASSPSTGPS